MGLDQYLTAERYVGGYEFSPERKEYERMVEMFGMKKYVTDDSPTAFARFTVGYWRKANHIHSWFVRECQNGIDECQLTNVSIEKLQELREVCLRVMASTKLIPGTVHTGTIYSAAHPKGAVQLEAGRIIEDPRVAEQLLAPEEGFFFGSQDYDESYWLDLERTVEIVDHCAKLDKYQEGWWDFQYPIVMVTYEDPSEDPVIIEAIINIKMAIQHIAPLLGTTWETPDLNEAMADLEQAVRFLEGKEEPS